MRSTVIDEKTFARIRVNAEKAWLNGKSHVRGSDRKSKGPEDQIVGQMGEYALAKFLGSPESYFVRRDTINLRPWKGDDGSDFDGEHIDVKTSLMRASDDPMRYNLLVRPAERHEHNKYVLALVPSVESRKVLLVGWIDDSALPPEVESGGVFAGAYRVSAKELNEMNEL